MVRVPNHSFTESDFCGVGNQIQSGVDLAIDSRNKVNLKQSYRFETVLFFSNLRSKDNGFQKKSFAQNNNFGRQRVSLKPSLNLIRLFILIISTVLGRLP